MPITAELADGRRLEFPDGTDPAVIQATVKKMVAQPSQQSMADRLGAGIMDPIHGGAQLLTKVLPKSVVDAGNAANNWLADKTGLVARIPEGGVDQMVKDREREYQAARGETGFDAWRMAGNLISPASLTLGRLMPGASTLAAIAPKVPALVSGAVVGASAGSASGALSPVTEEGDFAEQKKRQMMLGAAGGSAVPVLAAGVGRVISPAASRNPDVQLLRESGVAPTIGQTLGGWANRAEEKFQSLPIFGDAITAARQRAQEQFNRAALTRAAEPIGAKVETVGQQGVADLGNKISAAYDAAKTKLGSFQLDRQAASELSTLKNMAQNLGDRERAAFDSVWAKLDAAVSPNGTVRADAFKMFDSKAGLEASRFQGSPDVYQQQVGDAIKEMQRIVLEAAKRAKPDAAKDLKAADAAYANLVRLEGASKGAMNNGGVFTPAQLQTAVRQADRSTRDRATARGEALMQDLSGAGQRVLGNKVADSGTAGRVALGGGALASGAINPAIPASLLGAGSLYLPPLQALLRGSVAARPQAAGKVANLLEEAAPMLIPAGGLLAPQVLK